VVVNLKMIGRSAGLDDALMVACMKVKSTSEALVAQINKVESIANPNDYGTLVRGLMVYGRKTVKATALTYAEIKG
jgi:hypothetical protein